MNFSNEGVSKRNGGSLFGALVAMTGVGWGIAGSVRTGAITLSLGAMIFVLYQYFHAKVRRRIELILPVGFCLVLFAVALTLPHAK
ncbi:MAG: hypothetical protein WCO08_00200 [Actinomycetes bacterium]